MDMNSFDMENPTAHLDLDFRYDFNLDENWFKIVSNLDTVIAVCDKSHAFWQFASNSKKRKFLSELQEKMLNFPQNKKGFLFVWNMTQDFVNQSLHHLASLLEILFTKKLSPLFAFLQVNVCSEEVMRQENDCLTCLEQVEKNLIVTSVSGEDIDLSAPDLKNREVLGFVFSKKSFSN